MFFKKDKPGFHKQEFKFNICALHDKYLAVTVNIQRFMTKISKITNY